MEFDKFLAQEERESGDRVVRRLTRAGAFQLRGAATDLTPQRAAELASELCRRLGAVCDGGSLGGLEIVPASTGLLPPEVAFVLCAGAVFIATAQGEDGALAPDPWDLLEGTVLVVAGPALRTRCGFGTRPAMLLVIQEAPHPNPPIFHARFVSQPS